MECSVCGAKIQEGDKFCTSCGSPVDQMNPASESNAQVNAGGASDVPYSQPAIQYVRTDAPYNQPDVKVSQETNDQLNMKYIMHDHDNPINIEINSLASTTLTMGILSLVFLFLYFPPVIFGIIGIINGTRYTSKGYPYRPKVKAGKVMSIIGLILGSILSFIFLIGFGGSLFK